MMKLFRQTTAGLRALAAATVRVVIAAVVGVALAAPVWAADDPPGRVGRVANILGQAWMQDDDQTEWTVVPRNQPLTRGDRLMTDGDSRIEVQIGSTWLRLDGRTEVLLSRLDDDQVAVRVVRGSVAVRIRQPEVLRDWSLDAADGSLLPATVGHFRLDVDARGATASVLAGEARFSLGSGGLTLRAGQRVVSDGAVGNLQTRWMPLADDDFERWLRREDDAQAGWTVRDQLSPEMTGIQDLDRYGRWDQHPEYGAIWSPTVVPAGWAPYRLGRWTWVAPWGWTWVDDAPWGFAPSHYGRWVHWGGRWCWAPGPAVRRPVYAPALVAWVGGNNWGVSVSSGPLVSWVPLAPRESYRPNYHASPEWILRVNAPHRDPRWGRDFDRDEPSRYVNRAAPGGITVVPGEVFHHGRPQVNVPRLADDSVHRIARDPQHHFPPVAPPAAPLLRRESGEVRRPVPVDNPRFGAPAGGEGGRYPIGREPSPRFEMPAGNRPERMPDRDRSLDRSGERLPERPPVERPMERPAERRFEPPTERAVPRPFEMNSLPASERIQGGPALPAAGREEPRGQFRSGDGVAPRSMDRPNERAPDRQTDRAAEPRAAPRLLMAPAAPPPAPQVQQPVLRPAPSVAPNAEPRRESPREGPRSEPRPERDKGQARREGRQAE